MARTTLSFLRGTAIAGALLLSACSGGEESTTGQDSDAEVETTTTTEATTTTTPTTTTEAEADIVVEATTTTTAPTTTTAEPTTTTTTAVAQLSDDPVVIAYCTASAQAEALAANANVDSVESFDALLIEQLALIEGIEAPPAIADDLQMVTEGLRAMSAALEGVTSLEEVAPALSTVTDAPEFGDAGDNLDAFEAEFCPVVDTTSSPSTTDNPLGITEEDILGFLSTPEGREGIAQGVTTTSNMTQEEALCFVENTDPSILVGLFQLGTGGITEPSAELQAGLLAGLEACGLGVEAFG